MNLSNGTGRVRKMFGLMIPPDFSTGSLMWTSMKWKIPLFKIYWDEEDVESVTGVIRKGASWSIGEEIESFEEMTSEYLDREYAVAFNSGTSALYATLLAFEVEPGAEVVVPSFTFIATANSPLFVGARPVFADIEERTYGLDPLSIQEKITKKTKVLMPIHYGGLPCQIAEIKEVAEDHNLILIEDAAEALGANVSRRKAGSFGDAAILSFCQNKIVTTGEGGMVVTDSKRVYDKLKEIRSHGRQELEPYFNTEKSLDYIVLGYNWRVSSMTAALGVSQMRKINRVIAMRRKNARYLTKKLSKIEWIDTPKSPEGFFHTYQMYTATIRAGGDARDKLRKFLARAGIMTRVYFEPVHLTNFYKRQFGYKGGELPVTEKVSKEVLTLPMYPTLTTDEMDYVAKTVNIFMKDAIFN